MMLPDDALGEAGLGEAGLGKAGLGKAGQSAAPSTECGRSVATAPLRWFTNCDFATLLSGLGKGVLAQMKKGVTP